MINLNPLPVIASGWKRYMHTRGHGVHSPLAYALVTQVVHPGRKYEYYGYFDIDALLGESNASVREMILLRENARLLFRLAAWLNVRSVFVDPSLPQAYSVVPRLVDSRCRVVTRSADASDCKLAVIGGDFMDDNAVEELIDAGETIMALGLPEEKLASAYRHMREGLLLNGRSVGILMPREGMAKQSYTVCI